MSEFQRIREYLVYILKILKFTACYKALSELESACMKKGIPQFVKFKNSFLGRKRFVHI